MRYLYALFLLPALFSASVPADSSSSAAASPGSAPLTPVGAERAGNASGSIPPWTGGLTAPPAAYVPGKHEVDPFAEDALLFSITADKLDAYADKLSPGQQALLRAHPDSWYMQVYPTHRSASYPDWVYSALQDNAQTAAVLREPARTRRLTPRTT